MVYRKLQEFLDKFPLGFPQTSTGVEIKILKRLFTEKEAEIAVLLTPLPEEPAKIAQRAGLDERDLGEKLESMSRKGLVFRTRREGKTLYNSTPFMIGLYEYSVKKIDKELAALYKEYYDSAYMDEMGASNVPGFKVLPIDKNISGEITLFPFHRIMEEIKSARRIAVAECICRKEARLTGDQCDHTMETCISFGVAAEYYIENGMGREVTAEEAIQIVEEADKAGLIHAGANTKHLSNICNCCPCCCASMKGITKRGLDKRKYLNALFVAVIDNDRCVGCDDCTDRCPVEAVSVDEVAEVEEKKCIGCGLCAGACENEAITLEFRGDRGEPFDRMLDLGMAILKGKRGNS